MPDPIDVPDAGPSTGRLFRSLRAEGDTANTAVPALRLDEAIGLRSISLGSGEDGLPAAAAMVSDAREDPGTAPDLSAVLGAQAARPVPAAAEPPLEVLDQPQTPGSAATEAETPELTASRAAQRRREARALRGPSGWVVLAAEVLVVVAAGFVNALATNQIGIITGAVLIGMAVIGALLVRQVDGALAVMAPPLAFFAALITAGQLTVGPGDAFITQGLLILQGLGTNAVWIFAATVLAWAIVWFRRR